MNNWIFNDTPNLKREKKEVRKKRKERKKEKVTSGIAFQFIKQKKVFTFSFPSNLRTKT